MAQIKNVTELDFDQIKTNLKVFLSSQDKFNDYDFDGAGMNVLLDILSYNTQYNALLAHMSMNEAFLDSAQVRSNVVSHAKNLGYIPQSNRAAQAYMKITVTGDADSPAELQIPKGTAFTGQIGSNTYTYVTNGSFLANKISFNNQYIFDKVIAHEGKLVNLTYRVDNKEEFQKFRIGDLKVDTSTMVVRVRESLTSSEYETYTHYDNLVNVNNESKVYFLQENGNGQYEFYFGDGVLGYKPITGQIVELTYISTNGLEGNGSKEFSANSPIGGFTSILIELADGFTKTVTGSDKETSESIKFNAPKKFATQNRAVTSEDYKSILIAEYDFIEDISVWGGDVAVPPVYGKVYISIKPKDSEVLTESSKTTIKRFLTTKNVGSITADLVDPDYTFITMNVFFKYDPSTTSRTIEQLRSAIRQTISDYNDIVLEKYDGVLRQSKLLKAIDDTDQGILNSVIRLKMHKHMNPISGTLATYTLQFSSPMYKSDSNESIISTSEFTVNGIECVATDIPIAGSINHQIQIISAETGNIVIANAGTVYVDEGKVEFASLQIDSNSEVLIYASPNSNDIAPKFNQIVKIEMDETPGITVTGEEDLIATLGSAGASEYTTFPRHD
jgi:hypothetical protein